jgi:hypothetical protein
MTKPDDTIRVVIPLTIRKRNGRPKILPPQGTYTLEAPSQDPQILRALGRAWAWRRKLQRGEVATAGELAQLEGVTDRFISRTMRLAFLSPEVLECILVERQPLGVTWNELVASTSAPWSVQRKKVLGG